MHKLHRIENKLADKDNAGQVNETTEEANFIYHCGRQTTEIQPQIINIFSQKSLQRTTHLKSFSPLCLILLFVLLIPQTSSSTCEKSFIDLGNSYYNSCEMCYFQFSQSLYFLKCQQKINCTKESHGFFNWGIFSAEEYCEFETDILYEQTKCETLCCPHFKAATSYKDQQKQQVYTLQYCQAQKDIKSQLIALFASLITSPFTLIIIILILCYCSKERQRQRANTLAGNFGKPEESFIDQNNIQLSGYRLESYGPEKVDDSQTCAVCLDERCNLYTKCGHLYHAKCLRQWLVKRPKCPVCVSKQYNPVKIFCRKCGQGVKMEILQRHPLSESEMQELENLNNSICEQCKYSKLHDILQSINKDSDNQKSFRQKRISMMIKDEQKISAIQHVAEDINKSEQFQFQFEEQIQTKRKLSSSLNDVRLQQSEKEKRKHDPFSQPIKDYIESFRKQRFSKESQNITNNFDHFPDEETKNSLLMKKLSAPQELISNPTLKNQEKPQQGQFNLAEQQLSFQQKRKTNSLLQKQHQ